MIRGAAYTVDLGNARGHEQRGKRLGIVMSPSQSPLSVATVVPTSTRAQRSRHRPQIEIVGQPTFALVDQVRSIDITYIGDEPVDVLTRDQFYEVELALALYLGLHATDPFA